MLFPSADSGNHANHPLDRKIEQHTLILVYAKRSAKKGKSHVGFWQTDAYPESWPLRVCHFQSITDYDKDAYRQASLL